MRGLGEEAIAHDARAASVSGDEAGRPAMTALRPDRDPAPVRRPRGHVTWPR
ncbi:uncharacterized protein SOCEGT47_009760 [Sorangium cellulosum]|uniref:Uncharacterized protein n=1 Tax=Sorangium cellulosum TaxID=56 RepID=A0A4P2PUZ0_SORCE|nr:uncharacterized protein SOCEGT47_009760 [Sorangium cellulosum]